MRQCLYSLVGHSFDAALAGHLRLIYTRWTRMRQLIKPEVSIGSVAFTLQLERVLTETAGGFIPEMAKLAISESRACAVASI